MRHVLVVFFSRGPVFSVQISSGSPFAFYSDVLSKGYLAIKSVLYVSVK